MRRNFLFPLAPLLTGLSLSSCALMYLDDTFEPDETSFHRPLEQRLDFVALDFGKPIDQEMLSATGEAYQVGPGDVLKIGVVEIPETETETVVLPDGMLYFDVVAPVPAAGKTLTQLELIMADSLRDLYPDPVVAIQVAEVKSRTYTVMGQVVEPGVYPLDRPTTLLEAISLAGGVSSREVASVSQNLADLRRSVVLRHGHVIPVDFAALIEEGDMSQNIHLRPGDYLYLPAKGTEKVYVMGSVVRPGPVPHSSDMTFIRALASAGGPAPSSFRSGVLVVRDAMGGEPRVASINLHKLLQGELRDFPIEANDIIWVPKAPWKKLSEYAEVATTSAVSTIAIQEAAENFNGD